MIVTCLKCGTGFHLKEDLVKNEGSLVRCSRCRHVFKVFLPEEPIPEPRAESEAPEPESSPEKAPEPDFRAFAGLKENEAAPEETRRFRVPLNKDFPTEKPPAPAVEIRADPDDSSSSSYPPFKVKLLRFAALLIGLVALIVIPIELYRPITKLKELIDNAKNLIAGVNATVDPLELQRMNRFALREIEPKTHYHGLAFNMLLLEGKILPEKAILGQTELIKYLEAETGPFSYPELLSAAEYWRIRFDSDPGMLGIFRKYKLALIRVREDAEAAGFLLRYFMIMLDTGLKKGAFAENVAFLLESTPWWEYPTHCGQLYKVEAGSAWRDLALSGKEGFAHSRISDPGNFFLPNFWTDEYGTWFTVWMTRKAGPAYNMFSIDFAADRVKQLLLIIGALVVGCIAVLTALAIWISERLSHTVTRPITELTRGAEEVAKGNYEYRVPVLKNDEFGALTRQFNDMTKGQMERLNLMNTLEKFLSRDLAEIAARQGLILGGKTADCTVMFTDFAGFSTITRKMSAVEAVNVLNSYFGGLVPIIKKYGGFPDKYIGDAIVALFGAPVKLEDHAERALACAVEMQWKMRELNDMRRREGRTVFEMRIGLNSGEVIAGAIGCDMKLEYTSIGETTNLANRMESICEIGHVMMAEGTYRKIEHLFFRGVEIEATPRQMMVKGYPKPVSCYRVFVDDISIEKDLESTGPIKSFYIYTETRRKLRYRIEDIKGGRLLTASHFLQ